MRSYRQENMSQERQQNQGEKNIGREVMNLEAMAEKIAISLLSCYRSLGKVIHALHKYSSEEVQNWKRTTYAWFKVIKYQKLKTPDGRSYHNKAPSSTSKMHALTDIHSQR